MKSKESNFQGGRKGWNPGHVEGLSLSTGSSPPPEGREEGGGEGEGRANGDTAQLVNSLGRREFLSNEVFQLLAKEEVSHQLG